MTKEERTQRISILLEDLVQELWEHLYVCGDPWETVGLIKMAREKLDVVLTQMNSSGVRDSGG